MNDDLHFKPPRTPLGSESRTSGRNNGAGGLGPRAASEHDLAEQSMPPVATGRGEGILLAHPRYEELMPKVELGEGRFNQLAMELKLLDSTHTSAVHEFGEVKLHAFAACLGAEDHYGAVQSAFTIFATHPLDDKFDRVEERAIRELFHEHRGSLSTFLDGWSGWGRLVRELVSLSRHPGLMRKAISRIGYGGLLLHETRASELEQLKREYVSISTKDLGPEMRGLIASIPTEYFLLTTKTTQELFGAFDRVALPDRAELWSIIYTGIFLYADLPEERAKGEAKLWRNCEPGGVAAMIRSAAALIDLLEPAPSRRLEQFSFVLDACSANLPDSLREEYDSIRKLLVSQSAREGTAALRRG